MFLPVEQLRPRITHNDDKKIFPDFLFNSAYCCFLVLLTLKVRLYCFTVSLTGLFAVCNIILFTTLAIKYIRISTKIINAPEGTLR